MAIQSKTVTVKIPDGPINWVFLGERAIVGNPTFRPALALGSDVSIDPAQGVAQVSRSNLVGEYEVTFTFDPDEKPEAREKAAKLIADELAIERPDYSQALEAMLQAIKDAEGQRSKDLQKCGEDAETLNTITSLLLLRPYLARMLDRESQRLTREAGILVHLNRVERLLALAVGIKLPATAPL